MLADQKGTWGEVVLGVDCRREKSELKKKEWKRKEILEEKELFEKKGILREKRN